MDGDITDLLLCAGAVLAMVLFWTYYILDVRKEPRSEEWYDEFDYDGAARDGTLLFILTARYFSAFAVSQG